MLTLSGFGIKIKRWNSHLYLEDGVGLERRAIRLSRVDFREKHIRRIVCIGADGYVTLDALEWLADVGASFVMLDRLGKVRIVTGPASPSEARLRRAQALALSNGAALRIARELISAKLTGQEKLVQQQLKNDAVAHAIVELKSRLVNTENLDAVRAIESHAAILYWAAWRDVPVMFPRKDVGRVPVHWLTFGPRHSPLTGGPRLSVNPANSLLNYTNAIAESECRLAVCICGLDPGLGFIHTDTANRDSLALDLIETIRPEIEAWLLNWLLTEPLRRSDFFETENGNCRISSSLCEKLSETALTWRKLVSPWAEFIVRELWATTRSSRGNQSLPPTRLTQQRKREMHGNTFTMQTKPALLPDRLCRDCGRKIRCESTHCSKCSIEGATARLVIIAQKGRVAARSPKARAKHSESARHQARVRSSWNPSSQPAWLTPEFYSAKIQPLLANLSTSAIRSKIGVSRLHAIRIRKGYRPHPRHWLALAELVGANR